MRRSGNLEQAFDFDGGVHRQHRNADRGAGVASLFAEGGHHQVRRAVHHLGSVDEIRLRRDEATETHDADDLVEIAERGLDLGENVDRTGARRFLPILDRDAPAETTSRFPVRTKPT